MADRKKTCFVICPIGEDGSEVRQRADELFDLIINPALELFGFDIVRADKISSPSVITNDIVRLVQDSELCVVDLTGQNPNVYYECGRRHENGKPTIQLIYKGEKIPFDVAGIRTISFDLSTPRTIRDTVITVREFVKPFEASGYVISSSGASLTSIAESIDRIERQLSRIKAEDTSGVTSPSGKDLFLKGPKGAIESALNSGEIDRAELLYEKLKDRLPINQLISVGSSLTLAGSGVAKNVLLSEFDNLSQKVDDENIIICIGSIVQYYVVNDLEKQGLIELDDFLKQCLEMFSTKADITSAVYWQLARLSVYTPDKRFDYAKRAYELNPEEYKEMFAKLRK